MSKIITHYVLLWLQSTYSYLQHLVLTANSPDVKRTIDLRQEYSAVSTCRAFSFSTCSWKTRMWSMKATTRSADIGEACRPAAAKRGATWSGMEHWAALRTKSSLHDMRNSATWNKTVWRDYLKQGYDKHLNEVYISYSFVSRSTHLNFYYKTIFDF